MLITLGLFWILIMSMAFMPVPDNAWGAFAEDFKVWCFGYDPETGTLEMMYLVMFTMNPVMLSVVIWFVWQEPLNKVWSNPILVKPYALSSLLLVVTIGFSFLLMYKPPAEEVQAFRPDALRTSLNPPDFTLINSEEKPVSLNDYKDKVVLLTSIYTSCSDTCPMILDQAKNVLDELEESEREDIILMAITMQPEKDTPELLNRVAGYYRLDQYNYEMLTGNPEDVHRVLDYIGIARKTDEVTGEISHVNLFLLIGRDGKIAFRFSLGDNQKEWMAEAARLLINEDLPERITEAYE